MGPHDVSSDHEDRLRRVERDLAVLTDQVTRFVEAMNEGRRAARDTLWKAVGIAVTISIVSIGAAFGYVDNRMKLEVSSINADMKAAIAQCAGVSNRVDMLNSQVIASVTDRYTGAQASADRKAMSDDLTSGVHAITTRIDRIESEADEAKAFRIRVEEVLRARGWAIGNAPVVPPSHP